MLALFRRRQGRGRPPYDRLPIIYAFLSCYTLHIQSIQALVDRLNNDPALRKVCGFHGRIPHRSTFSRTFSVLASNRHLAYEAFEELTRQLLALNPEMGKLLAIDGSTVPAWANICNKKTRDPEAGWVKSYSAHAVTDDGMVWVFGYKIHMVACADQALPLSFLVTPANTGESPLLRTLVEKNQASYPHVQPHAMMADRGYDSIANSELLHKRGIAPIIPRRDLKNRRENKPLYTLKGEPICMGGQAMEFTGTDPETGMHGFRCPLGGCRRSEEGFKGYATCGDWSWEDPDDNAYEVGGRVSRASKEWDELYSKRWEVERYFSLLKNNGWVENHRLRGLARVDLHITLGVLMFQAAALDRIAKSGIQAALPGLRNSA